MSSVKGNAKINKLNKLLQIQRNLLDLLESIFSDRKNDMINLEKNSLTHKIYQEIDCFYDSESMRDTNVKGRGSPR